MLLIYFSFALDAVLYIIFVHDYFNKFMATFFSSTPFRTHGNWQLSTFGAVKRRRRAADMTFFRREEASRLKHFDIWVSAASVNAKKSLSLSYGLPAVPLEGILDQFITKQLYSKNFRKKSFSKGNILFRKTFIFKKLFFPTIELGRCFKLV